MNYIYKIYSFNKFIFAFIIHRMPFYHAKLGIFEPKNKKSRINTFSKLCYYKLFSFRDAKNTETSS